MGKRAYALPEVGEDRGTTPLYELSRRVPALATHLASAFRVLVLPDGSVKNPTDNFVRLKPIGGYPRRQHRTVQAAIFHL